jgi:hypothetical protein
MSFTILQQVLQVNGGGLGRNKHCRKGHHVDLSLRLLPLRSASVRCRDAPARRVTSTAIQLSSTRRILYCNWFPTSREENAHISPTEFHTVLRPAAYTPNERTHAHARTHSTRTKFVQRAIMMVSNQMRTQATVHYCNKEAHHFRTHSIQMFIFLRHVPFAPMTRRETNILIQI